MEIPGGWRLLGHVSTTMSYTHYDVTPKAVEVLAILTKAEASRWFAEHGAPDAPSGAG